LKQYSQTNNSEVQWIEEIPKHWKVERMKYRVKINQKTLDDKTDPNLEILYIDVGSVHAGGKIDEPEKMNFKDAPSRARRIVNQNDTIVSTVRTYLKAIAFIDETKRNYICSTGFAVISADSIDPNFLYFSVNSQYFIDTIEANSKGVAYPAINPSQLGNLKISFPPTKKEQQQIASYLDKKTKTIDNEILKNQNLIKLLKEKKQSEINRAVTKGLDHTVPMENSEVQWFGKIPKGWSIQKIKFHYEITTGKVLQSNKNNDNEILINFITAGNVFWNTLDLNNLTKMWATPEQIKKLRLKENDLLICEGGEAGRCAILTGLKTDCILQNHVHRLRGKNYFSNKFLMYVMKYYDDISLLQTIVEKVTLTSLSTSDLGNIQMPLPPTDDEIEQITSYLDKKTKKIDSLISKVELQISKLQEFRESLISSAVTGKIKVTQA